MERESRPICRRFAKWRDPDSNRGHHDFQACVSASRIGRNLLQTSGIGQRSRERTTPANSILSSAIWDMDGAPSPDGARVLLRPRIQGSVARAAVRSSGAWTASLALPWARIYNSGWGFKKTHARGRRSRTSTRSWTDRSHLTDPSSAVAAAAAVVRIRPHHADLALRVTKLRRCAVLQAVSCVRSEARERCWAPSGGFLASSSDDLRARWCGRHPTAEVPAASSDGRGAVGLVVPGDRLDLDCAMGTAGWMQGDRA
jgi:hypothetical protein